MAARSFCTNVNSPDQLGAALRETRGSVPAPTGGLVFVTGSLVQHIGAVAARVRSAWKGIPTVVVPAAGVLHERTEIEGMTAASGILWSGGRVTPFAIGDAEETPRRVGESIGQALEPRAGTAILFHRPEGFDASLLEGIAATAPSACVFGAGAVGADPIASDADGLQMSGRAVGLSIKGLASPIVAAAPACRLLTDFSPIEEVSAGLVLKFGGKSALDELSRCSPAAKSSSAEGATPLIFAALAEEGDIGDDGRPRYIIRPVRGVDPTRRGVMIGGDAKPGVRMSFAVRDASQARADLESTARIVSKNALGAAPRFALHLSCAGRGQGLYGIPDVEVRILRQRFGDLPIAGMHAAFEISPRPGKASRLELYTSVLALFRSPS